MSATSRSHVPSAADIANLTKDLRERLTKIHALCADPQSVAGLLLVLLQERQLSDGGYAIPCQLAGIICVMIEDAELAAK
jgi:hypothetical protein